MTSPIKASLESDVVAAARNEGIRVSPPDKPVNPGTMLGAVAERDFLGGWISPSLLAETQAVWSREYGRPVDAAEATEILLNVKRLAKLLVALNQEAR